MEILGVKRDGIYSPNHIGNDDAIFNLTTKALQAEGFTVTVQNEKEFLDSTIIKEEFIFTMARKKEVISKLQIQELTGTAVINSAFGIESCFRTNLTRSLTEQGIPYPKSKIVLTDNPAAAAFDGIGHNGFWLKRGDFHAIHKEDVTFVADEEEGRHIIQEFYLRGIPDVVISENLPGDLVKFYGVRDTGFFYWFYPYDHNHHKYKEYEAINGTSMYYPFSEDELKKEAGKAAEAVNIHIYGGDAIIGKNGSFHIIDFNDWPSFAPCRENAFPFITECIVRQFTQKHRGTHSKRH